MHLWQPCLHCGAIKRWLRRCLKSVKIKTKAPGKLVTICMYARVCVFVCVSWLHPAPAPALAPATAVVTQLCVQQSRSLCCCNYVAGCKTNCQQHGGTRGSKNKDAREEEECAVAPGRRHNAARQDINKVHSAKKVFIYKKILIVVLISYRNYFIPYHIWIFILQDFCIMFYWIFKKYFQCLERPGSGGTTINHGNSVSTAWLKYEKLCGSGKRRLKTTAEHFPHFPAFPRESNRGTSIRLIPRAFDKLKIRRK